MESQRSLPLQRCFGELGCTEIEWEELNPKLNYITVWTERQITRDVSGTLAGGEHPFSGLSVVQAQVTAMSTHTPFLSPFISEVLKVTKKQITEIKFIPGILVIPLVLQMLQSRINKYG